MKLAENVNNFKIAFRAVRPGKTQIVLLDAHDIAITSWKFRVVEADAEESDMSFDETESDEVQDITDERRSRTAGSSSRSRKRSESPENEAFEFIRRMRLFKQP